MALTVIMLIRPLFVLSAWDRRRYSGLCSAWFLISPSAKYFMPSAATAPAFCLLTCAGQMYTVHCSFLLYTPEIPAHHPFKKVTGCSNWFTIEMISSIPTAQPLILPSHCRQKNKVRVSLVSSGIHKRFTQVLHVRQDYTQAHLRSAR